MEFVKKNKLAFIIVSLLVIFVIYNLARDANVEKISQSEAPTVAEIQAKKDQQTASTKPSAEEIDQNEQTQQPTSAKEPALQTTATGQFTDGMGTYKGEGTVEILVVDGKPVLKFGDNFSATNGPDLQVYMSPNKDAKNNGLGSFISLGGLQSQSGAQVYNLPDNYADFASVVIWCRTFQGVFAQADLELAN